MDEQKTICISAKGLHKRFEKGRKSVQAFQELDLEIKKGEFFSIIGPSGCGKTTLLRCLAGIETPTGGTLNIHTEEIQDQNRIAMVFQEHGLYPWMTVKENLQFVLSASSIDSKKHDGIIDHFLKQVGLTRFHNFYPYQLSGGMNQRVALVRAFCVYPQLLLMDEPFVFLDYQNRVILQNLLLELWEEQRQTIVFVTHNINEAATMADRLVVMTAGPGRIRREVRCEFERPRDVIGIRENPDFQRIVVQITSDLRDEIEMSASEKE